MVVYHQNSKKSLITNRQRLQISIYSYFVSNQNYFSCSFPNFFLYICFLVFFSVFTDLIFLLFHFLSISYLFFFMNSFTVPFLLNTIFFALLSASASALFRFNSNKLIIASKSSRGCL